MGRNLLHGMRPQRLGRYELLRHLASGGMARVYIARVTGPGGFARHLVVKTIPEERRNDDAFIAMFLDEARLMATLHHQHIAQVFEVGCADDGSYFLAMEYVHGETVRQVLEVATKRRAQLSVDVGLSVTCAAAAGLHHAHERRDLDGTPLGIVHRDVSPSNLLLGYDGSVKLIDFGIAKAHLRTTQTASGVVKGKAGYMAPEQVRGEPVDRRSDVFALGVLAYELTTQTRAFHGATEFEAMRRTIHGEIDPPSQRVAGYPPALEDVVMTALAPDPADRFQDADAMRVALEQIARELGATLGDAPVIRALDKLFPPRPEPWFAGDESEGEEETTGVRSNSDPQIMIAPRTSTKLRLARGTENPESTGVPDGEFEQLKAELQAIPEPIPTTDVRELTIDLATEPFERSTRAPIDPMLAAAATAPISTRARVRRTTPCSAAALPVPSTPDLAPPLPSPPWSAATLPLPPTPTTPLPFPQPADAIDPDPDMPTVDQSAEPEPPTIRDPVRQRRGGATQQLASAGPYRRYVLIVVITAALVVCSLVIALLQSRASSAPTRSKPAQETQVPVPSPRPVAPAQPPAVATREPRTTVMLHVTSDPSGATVVLDGVRLGVTPFSAPVAMKDGPAWLKVRLRRHAAVKTRVSLDKDVRWDVQLRRLAR